MTARRVLPGKYSTPGLVMLVFILALVLLHAWLDMEKPGISLLDRMEGQHRISHVPQKLLMFLLAGIYQGTKAMTKQMLLPLWECLLHSTRYPLMGQFCPWNRVALMLPQWTSLLRIVQFDCPYRDRQTRQ